VLEANRLLTPQLSAFIMQDADAVFRNMPGITQRLSSAITDVGAVSDRLISGENIDKKMPETAWMKHVKSTLKAHKGKNLKEVLKIASNTYKKSSL
jgi:HD-like signal output (HDOD) protein